MQKSFCSDLNDAKNGIAEPQVSVKLFYNRNNNRQKSVKTTTNNHQTETKRGIFLQENCTVSCPGCPSRPTLPAADTMTAQTSVLVTNLQEGLSYTFVVTAHNGVSNLSTSALDSSRSSEIMVATESADGASVVSSVAVTATKPMAVQLSWQPPSDPLLDIEVYEVI